MAPKRSSTFWATWIGVLGAVLLALLTVPPLIETNRSQEFEYIGRVIDHLTQFPIVGAKVTLDVQGASLSVDTDSEGVYQFRVMIKDRINGHVSVEAQGYQPYTRNVILSRNFQTIEDIRLLPAPQIQATDTPIPTTTPVVASAPIIDAIDILDVMVCDRRKYDVIIHFRDLDGDAHRIEWELLYSKKQTVLYAEAKEFAIDSQRQKRGAIFLDFIQWYIPGDEVRIRVNITDRAGLSGSKDFEFKCSNET